MRIGFVTTSSMESPYAGGRCFPIAKYLARMGHEVHIVGLHHDWTDQPPRRWSQDGVHVHQVGPMHVRKVGNSTSYLSPPQLVWAVLQGSWALARALVRLAPHVIHIGKPHPQNSFAAFWAHRRLPNTCVLLDYDDYELGINRFGNLLEREVIRCFEHYVPRHVAAVTTHTTYLYERLQKLGIPSQRILRLPSGFDPEMFSPLATEKVISLRKKLNLQDKHVVLYIGTISFVNHAVDLLLEAFARVRRRREDVMLVVVGGGADLQRTQKIAEQLGIASHCRFPGRVSRDQIPLFMALADLSVDPTRDTEAERARWPLKIVESLASGVPVVTGDIGDRRSILMDGQAGILVRPNDPEELAGGILDGLGDEGKRHSMAKNAKLCAGTYEAHKIAERLTNFYLQCLGKQI